MSDISSYYGDLDPLYIFSHYGDHDIYVGSNPHIYAIRGLKVACINFHMFLGMVKETSKAKKWSKGSKESAVGQGNAIQV